MFIRIHAGSYISGCGNVKIRRRQETREVRGLTRKVWVWDVSLLGQTGVFEPFLTVRTLKVAKEQGRRFVHVPMVLF